VAAYLPILFRRSNEATSTRTFQMSCPIWVKFGTKNLQVIPLSNCEFKVFKVGDDVKATVQLRV